MYCNWRVTLAHHNYRKPHAATKIQHSQTFFFNYKKKYWDGAKKVNDFR